MKEAMPLIPGMVKVALRGASVEETDKTLTIRSNMLLVTADLHDREIVKAEILLLMEGGEQIPALMNVETLEEVREFYKDFKEVIVSEAPEQTH